MNSHDQLIEELSHAFVGMKRVAMQSRDQMLGELQLTRTQIEILMMLRERDGQTIGELASSLAVTHSASTQTVETLVKRNLLERRPHPADRRMVRTYLTQQAHELTNRLRAGRQERMKAACSEFSDEELTLMIAVLSRLTKQFEVNPSTPNNPSQESSHVN